MRPELTSTTARHTCVMTRHTLVLLIRDPGTPLAYTVMSLVLLSVLHPVYDRLATPGTPGIVQAAPGIAVMFTLLALDVAGQLLLSERTWHTWDRLRSGPASPSAILAGKAAPLITIFLLQQAILFLFATAAFGFPSRPAPGASPCWPSSGRPASRPAAWHSAYTPAPRASWPPPPTSAPSQSPASAAAWSPSPSSPTGSPRWPPQPRATGPSTASSQPSPATPRPTPTRRRSSQPSRQQHSSSRPAASATDPPEQAPPTADLRPDLAETPYSTRQFTSASLRRRKRETPVPPCSAQPAAPR